MKMNSDTLCRTSLVVLRNNLMMEFAENPKRVGY